MIEKIEDFINRVKAGQVWHIGPLWHGAFAWQLDLGKITLWKYYEGSSKLRIYRRGLFVWRITIGKFALWIGD